MGLRRLSGAGRDRVAGRGAEPEWPERAILSVPAGAEFCRQASDGRRGVAGREMNMPGRSGIPVFAPAIQIPVIQWLMRTALHQMTQGYCLNVLMASDLGGSSSTIRATLFFPGLYINLKK